jgi:hypothetical protein
VDIHGELIVLDGQAAVVLTTSAEYVFINSLPWDLSKKGARGTKNIDDHAPGVALRPAGAGR